MEATAAMVSVAMGVGFVPLPTFFHRLKDFQMEVPFGKCNWSSLSNIFQACLRKHGL